MRVWFRILFALGSVIISPAAAYAQASIAGIVKDASGAVLPGVTVEASSPALIERTRTAVTDGEGRYRLVDLRSGTYTVTFTLQGFRSVRREGIELSTGFIATVNADLGVGAHTSPPGVQILGRGTSRSGASCSGVVAPSAGASDAGASPARA